MNTCTAFARGRGWDMNACSGANCPLGHLGKDGSKPACPHLANLLEASENMEGREP